jgi:geranylgeranyl diphosphate synthase type I
MIVEEILLQIDAELREILQRSPLSPHLRGMIEYHLGWRTVSTDAPPVRAGKGLRPLLVALAARSICGQHDRALPLAAGVELIHSFSLILDDIMDQDRVRHHRPALWVQQGVNQATTAGAALYTAGVASLLESVLRGGGARAPLDSVAAVLDACFETCNAQVLDLAAEETFEVSVDACLRMAMGRSALVACAPRAGALAGAGEQRAVEAYTTFGMEYATAYSLQDDYHGIWGREEDAGKPLRSDIRRRKKTYPVLVGYRFASPAKQEELGQIYAQGAISDVDERRVMDILKDSGALEKTLAEYQAHRERAFAALQSSGIQSAQQQVLADVAASFLDRRGRIDSY